MLALEVVVDAAVLAPMVSPLVLSSQSYACHVACPRVPCAGLTSPALARVALLARWFLLLICVCV